MRMYPGWIKTTLKEDVQIVRCIVSAYQKSPTPQQLRVLAHVKLNFLDRNNDLMAHLWEEFQCMLDDLGVERPEMNLNRSYPEKGSYYVIPAHGKLHRGRSREALRATRHARRHKEWQEAISANGVDAAEIDLVLADEDATIGRFRDEILAEFEAFERDNHRLRERLSELEDEFVLHSRSQDTLREDVDRLTGILISAGLGFNVNSGIEVSDGDTLVR